jgi:hypothetical protein
MNIINDVVTFVLKFISIRKIFNFDGFINYLLDRELYESFPGFDKRSLKSLAWTEIRFL